VVVVVGRRFGESVAELSAISNSVLALDYFREFCKFVGHLTAALIIS
jgi:hypothetical protein